MSIETDFVTWLEGRATLAGTRVYPFKPPQKPTLPLITYQKIDGPRVKSNDGPSALAHPRFQIGCWAETETEAKNLATQIFHDLHGFSGLMGTTTIDVALFEDERDTYEDPIKVWRTDLDFVIWHVEPRIYRLPAVAGAFVWTGTAVTFTVV
jgi:hypothetical protein